MTILDLGIGTGNLARRFVALGCAVWGTDFAVEMLACARQKVPQATLVRADLLGKWPTELNRRFDRIVSAQVVGVESSGKWLEWSLQAEKTSSLALAGSATLAAGGGQCQGGKLTLQTLTEPYRS